MSDNSSIRWIGEYDIIAEKLLLGYGLPDDGEKLSETIEALSACFKRRHDTYDDIRIFAMPASARERLTARKDT